MKKLLYIDTPFIGFNSGDKNRSKFLYEKLLKNYQTDLLLVKDKDYDTEVFSRHNKNNRIFTIATKKQSFLAPQAIYNFEKSKLYRLKEIICKNRYDICFIRFASNAKLAKFIKKIDPSIKIIFDVDMLFSQISKASWEQNRVFKNRYHFFEYHKLTMFERSFFKKDYRFLFTNKNELELVCKKYNLKDSDKYDVLPNVINEVNTTKLETLKDKEQKQKYILFYGVLNSTANISAYEFLINKIYPLLKFFLISSNIKIYIVGKNATALHKKKLQNVELIGEVDDVSSYIKNSLLVLFPLTVASGTLTRVLEVANLKKSIVATSRAANGLDLEGKIFIANKEEDIASDILDIYNDQELKTKYENIAYDFVRENYSSEKIEEKMVSIFHDACLNKNVLHIPRRFTKSHWGGTENVVLSIAKGLKDYGVKSKIFTSDILSNKKEEFINNIKVNRFSYFYPYFNLSSKAKQSLDLVGGNLFSWSLFYHLFFLKEVDLVHLHTGKRMGSIARTICRLRKIPYVITIHGGLYDISSSEVENRMRPLDNSFEWGRVLGFLFGSRKVYDDASSIITLSKAEFENIKRNYPNKDVHLLTNSIDVKSFQIPKDDSFRQRHGISNDKFVFFICARIDKQKNQLLALEALKDYILIDKNVHLLLAGNVTDTDYFKTLQDYIKVNKLEEYVTILSDLKPNSKELINCYLNSNAFILPSRHEPFGIVALEAWASSLPLIISDVCGICNVLKDKHTALVFEDNKKDELFNKMFYIKNNTQLKNNLIQASLKEVENYDDTLINGEINKIYEKSINTNKR